ncbi:hypothetical protein K1719_024552 [Acacia pycnantha]|nr:hypothetical protein K1719_024552 [Acacia pycnantha]
MERVLGVKLERKDWRQVMIKASNQRSRIVILHHLALIVLHWHIIDKQSFPLEMPSHPKLWKGSYTKWERYTVEDAYEIVK